MELSFRFCAFVAGGLLVGDPQNQLAIQFATRHINFRRRARRRCFRTEPDTTEPHGLMMFATKPRPSRRRYCRATLSWSTRTPSNFASIAPSSGRQHDPQHEAGMSRSRPSVNPAFSTPPILKICVSYQDKGSLLSSALNCFDTEGRPRAVQPRCAMSSFEPGLSVPLPPPPSSSSLLRCELFYYSEQRRRMD